MTNTHHSPTGLLRRVGLGMSLMVLLAASPAMAQKPKARVKVPEAYRYLQVTLQIQLRNHKTIRTRRSSFLTYRGRKRQKHIKMTNGPVWLNLKIHTEFPHKLAISGVLQLGKTFRKIDVRTQDINHTQEWNYIDKKTLKKAGAQIKIRAQVLINVTNKKSNYKLRFKNLSLRRVFKRLAEFGRYRLSYDASIPGKKGINLKLAAPTRKALIQQVCQKFQLKCQIMGQVLWVQPANAPTPR